MIRRINEAVAVRTAEQGAAGDPTTFLWRGRVYVVREVLAHWRERRAWWTGSAARAVHGAGDPGAESAVDPGAGAPTRPGARMTLNHEREVWRVEASAGRAFGTGVYDLCRDAAEELPDKVISPAENGWQLLRIAD